MILPELKGEQITLRRPRRSDAELFTRYLANRRVSRWLPDVPKPYALKDAYSFIRSVPRQVHADKGMPYSIHHQQHGHVAGGIALMNINRSDRNAEIGFWIAQPFWRQGLAFEATNLLCQYAFGRGRFSRLYAWVHSANTGSWRVLEKVGFVREGTCRKASRVGGRFGDVYFYGLLKSEFKPD